MLKAPHTAPIVRVMNNRPEYFKTALDLGAWGVMVPMINSAEDARRAVDSCRYPPLGTRGFGPIRASNYFLNLTEYAESANREVLLIAQIESPAAVQELEGIMAVPGIDAIFIGPGDLSCSLNIAAQWQHPRLQEVISQIIAKARKAGMPFGITTFGPEDFFHYVERGATFMTLGSDLTFMTQGATDALARTRTLLNTRKESAGN
jgi:2-keto-3-deoxy-L-rhamnonate aldolase RhmA